MNGGSGPDAGDNPLEMSELKTRVKESRQQEVVELGVVVGSRRVLPENSSSNFLAQIRRQLEEIEGECKGSLFLRRSRVF